jgi:hypothetical protein
VTLGGDYDQLVAALSGSIFLHADSSSKTRQFGDLTGSRYTTIDGCSRTGVIRFGRERRPPVAR